MRVFHLNRCGTAWGWSEKFTRVNSWFSISIMCLPKLMPVCVLIIGFITVLYSPISVGGACLADNRKVMVSKNVVRIRSYVCEVDDTTDIRVEFHRLNDTIVGDLIKGQESLLIRKTIGKFEIHKNAVFDATIKLFDQFGLQNTYYRSWSASNASGTYSDGTGYPTDPNIKINIEIGNDREIFFDSFPLPQVLRAARSGQNWSQDFNFFYQDCPKNKSPDHWNSHDFYCLEFWRPMTREDAKKYGKNFTDINTMLGIEWKNNNIKSETNLGINLLLHLTERGWPPDFSFIFGKYSPHGVMDFNYTPRKMFLDVAVIENLSNAPVSLDALYGRQRAPLGLYPLNSAQQSIGSCAVPFAKGLAQLAPNEKLLVPLRMVFTTYKTILWDSNFLGNDYESHEDHINRLKKDAEATYESIRLADPGPEGFSYPALQSLDEYDKDLGFFIKALKSPEDYKKPVYTTVRDYGFGPEISLCEIEVKGKRLDLIDKQANILEVTTSTEAGSCPYLFAWSELSNQWVSYGKIIHEALDKQRQDKEEIKLVELATRFRITEKELELSHIDMARLQIVTRDGRTTNLMPNIAALTQVDEDYVEIYAGGSIEFEFQLPGAIVKDDIVSSTLIVNGYYQLYTSPEILSRLPPLPASE